MQIRIYELKKKEKNKKKEKSERQTDRETETEKEREDKLSNKEEENTGVVLPPFPSKFTWVTKRNIRSTQADVSNIFEYT